MKKAALHNLGCKVNAYETEAMRQQLEDNGYEIVPFQEYADIYVVNTCTVTNIADRKSRQMLHKAKKRNPGSIVIAVGCYVQAAAEQLKKDEAVDIVIGNDKKKDLVRTINQYLTRDTFAEELIDIGAVTEYEELNLAVQGERTRAVVKIQDGCNQFCSYCIIPYVRGRVRSRACNEVIEEVENLASRGYKEIVLTGIHLSSYGIDFKGDASLLDLIRGISKIGGVERIRLGSLEPGIITEEFAAKLSKMQKICPHFHLSLQSGCDETLRRMNRSYTTGQYYEKCTILRKYFGNPAITTDIIVGFPGENAYEFETTVSFLKRLDFASMHIFKFSPRKGTRAAGFTEQINDGIKSERSDLLITLAKEMSRKYLQQHLKEEKIVLIEEKSMIDNKEYLIGHTGEYIKVAVPYRGDFFNRLLVVRTVDFLTDEILLAEFINMV